MHDDSKWIIGIKTIIPPNQKYGHCQYVWMAPKEEAEVDFRRRGGGTTTTTVVGGQKRGRR